MKQLRVGFALCGSFCTLSKAIAEMRELKSHILLIPGSEKQKILFAR